MSEGIVVGAGKPPFAKTAAVVLAVACLILASCKTDSKEPHPEKPQQPDGSSMTVQESSAESSDAFEDDGLLVQCDSVDDLNGVWECTDGTGFIYPFTAGQKTYLLYYGAWKDVTQEFASLANSQGISVDALWQKRNTIYSWKNPKNGREVQLPLSDENGVEKGVKFYRLSGRIYMREEYLVTEFIFGKNLRYFLMAQDGSFFKAGTIFHLFSSIFPDMNGFGKKYVRK